MIGHAQKSKRNFSNVYLTFITYIYHFILYNTIYFNKVNLVNVRHVTLHGNCDHDLSIGWVS